LTIARTRLVASATGPPLFCESEVMKFQLAGALAAAVIASSASGASAKCALLGMFGCIHDDPLDEALGYEKSVGEMTLNEFRICEGLAHSQREAREREADKEEDLRRARARGIPGNCTVNGRNRLPEGSASESDTPIPSGAGPRQQEFSRENQGVRRDS
jgi:hypothetical protein